jgi:alpha-ketoglutarate-dependent taurine dioxygenase
MKTRKISDTWGCLVTPSNSEGPQDLKYDDIVVLFERYGVLLFRGFSLEPESITTVTNRFTAKYSGEATRRPSRYGQKVVHDVDTSEMSMGKGIIGEKHVGWHSENSFSPSWSEVIWFYCVTPPEKGGKTMLCDGIALWNNLTVNTKSFFTASPVRYQLEIPIGKERPSKGIKPWFLNKVGTGDTYINWDTGTLHTTQLRFAMQEGRSGRDLCFSNHLLIAVDTEPQIISRTMADGSEIPENIMEEISEKADELAFRLSWEKGDLLMIDNRRFMHAREAYEPDSQRELLVVQSERANFGYGSNLTRKSIA